MPVQAARRTDICLKTCRTQKQNVPSVLPQATPRVRPSRTAAQQTHNKALFSLTQYRSKLPLQGSLKPNESFRPRISWFPMKFPSFSTFSETKACCRDSAVHVLGGHADMHEGEQTCSGLLITHALPQTAEVLQWQNGACSGGWAEAERAKTDRGRRESCALRGTSTATLWSVMETLVLRYQHTCMVVLARWWLCLSKELREECMSSSDSCSRETSSEDPGGGEFSSGLRKLCNTKSKRNRDSCKKKQLSFLLQWPIFKTHQPECYTTPKSHSEQLILAFIAQLCLGQLIQCSRAREER